jgi:hypothetical protein
MLVSGLGLCCHSGARRRIHIVYSKQLSIAVSYFYLCLKFAQLIFPMLATLNINSSFTLAILKNSDVCVEFVIDMYS